MLRLMLAKQFLGASDIWRHFCFHGCSASGPSDRLNETAAAHPAASRRGIQGAAA